jgi:hypothetical protein
MRRGLIILAILGVVLSFGVVAQAGNITIYDNYVSFLASYPSPSVENFEDTTLLPGLSIVSTNPSAVIQNGVYKDIVNASLHYTTTWNFTKGFTAFGGWFDLYYPGGPGTNILVELVDGGGSVLATIGEIPNTYKGGFWGFTIDTPNPFYHVKFSAGSNSGSQETYWTVDLAYTYGVPEPASLLLLGSGLVGLVAFRKRFKSA